MAAMMEFLSNSTEISSKEALVTATDFITNTLRTLIFTAATPSVGHASEKDKKLNQYSLKEVAEHDSAEDCWIILRDRVYDVTNFLDSHPGGYDIILEYAGRDCSIAFAGHSQNAEGQLKPYEIGILPPHERMYELSE